MRRKMSRTKLDRQRRPGSPTRRNLQVVIAIGIVLSLFAAWTILASSGALDSILRQKGKEGRTVSTADFTSSSPAKEYIYGGGRLLATEESSSTAAATPPTGLMVTADTVDQVHITWSWSPGQGEVLDHFVVERRQTINETPIPLTPSPPNAMSFNDNMPFGTVSSTGVVSGSVVTYLYRVLAVNTAGATSQPTNTDLATTIRFAQDPIQQYLTVVKKQDLAELRVCVNAVRTAAGLNQFTGWTDSDLTQPSIIIKTEHVVDLRVNLDEAINRINSPAPAYAETLQKQITLIKKAHFDELRKRVRHRST